MKHHAIKQRATKQRAIHLHSQRGASSTGLLLGLGVLGATALGWWFVAADGDEGAMVDPNRIVVVQRADVIDAVTASGRVEPLARVAVMSRASGIVKAVMVEEGDVVEEKQILAELDREQLEAEMVQDQADLQSAEARVSAAKARLSEAQARLEDPELAFAQREAERIESLYASQQVSLSERDAAARQLAMVEFRLTQIRSNLPVLEASVREAEANLASSKAAGERTQTALRETTIRSPVSGVVLTRDKEVGDGVSSILTAGGNATQLMTLGDLSEMWIEARVDEVDLGRIHEGMPALVTVDAYRSRTLEGEVARVAPAGSVDNNGIVTFEVRVTVKDPDGILRPDMTADAKLVIARRDQVLTLAARAIRQTPDRRFTVDRVVGEGESAKVETVEVKLGLGDGLKTEVLEGVQEGDRILVPNMGAAPPGRR